MIIRSKAPLRIGLAGGGTDVSPYSDIYGGAILNATINLYAQTTIEPLDNQKIIIESIDRKHYEELDAQAVLDINGNHDLVKGIYNRIVKEFVKHPLSFKITTHVDVPVGSGLGTSSSLVISILSGFVQWLNLPLGETLALRVAGAVDHNGGSGVTSANYGADPFVKSEALRATLRFQPTPTLVPRVHPSTPAPRASTSPTISKLTPDSSVRRISALIHPSRSRSRSSPRT